MAWAMVLVVLPFIIGMIGETFKKLILRGPMPKAGWPGWQGVYFITYKMHALLCGAIFGIFLFKAEIPWPKDVFGTSLGAAVLAGTFAGGVAMVAYASIVGTIKNAICQVSLKATAKAHAEGEEDQ